MPAFVNTNRMVLLGTAWTGAVAPGVGGSTAITNTGTITTPQDISAFVRSGNPSTTAAMQDVTTFGSGGFTQVIPGLRSGDDITFECVSDFAASQLYAIVQTTLGGLGAAVYLDIKPTNSARSATNPSFVAFGYISNWVRASGAVGDAAMASLTISISGRFADITG
jgi:hypothetical protein